MRGKCPHCHAEGVIVGKVYNQIDYVNPPTYFRPDNVSFLSILTSNIALPNSFSACSFCGHIWAKIDNQKLQRFMTGEGAV